MSGSSSSSSAKPGVPALPPLVPPLRFTTIALSPLAATHPPTKASSRRPGAAPHAHTTASSDALNLPSSNTSSASSSRSVSAVSVTPSSSHAARHPQRKAVAPSLAQAVYRGSHPKPRNLPFLTRLRLKTIVSLTPKPLTDVEPVVAEWAERSGVRLEWIKCEKPKDEAGGLTKEAAAKALTFMLDTRNLPLYVHCLDALNVTSLLTALLRKVQAWSLPSLLAELSMNLAVGNRGGPDEELFEYQRNFVAKWGTEGVKLAPRRFIPVWCWPAPYLLARLRDPYDVLVPPPLTTKEREKQAAERPSSSGDTASAPAAQAPSHHRRTSSVDSSLAPIAHVPPPAPAPAPPPPPSYGIGALPVLHPTLKLRFESDPDLPPPPKAPSPPPTPQTTSRHLARESSVASTSRAPTSPVASRPVSRSGRAPLASGSAAEPRVLSRPPSPRRRTLTAADPLGIEAERERERATGASPYLQHALHRTSSRPLAPSQLSHSSTPTSPPHSPPGSAMRGTLPSRLQQQYDSLSIEDGDVETPKRGTSSSGGALARSIPTGVLFGEESTPRARNSAASPRPSLRSRNSSSYSAGSSPVDSKAAAVAAYAERGGTSSPTPTARSRASGGTALSSWAASSEDSVELRSSAPSAEEEAAAYSTSPEDAYASPPSISRRASSRGSYADAEEAQETAEEEEEEIDEEDSDDEEEEDDEEEDEEEDEDEDGSDAASDRALEALDLA